MLQRLLLICILFCSLRATAVPVVYLTRDSIPTTFRSKWLFSQGDDAAKAAVDYNDSSWRPLTTLLPIIHKEDEARAADVNWFRLHIIVDSTLTGIPLGGRMSQEGASEVFLDGKRIAQFGRISGDSSQRYDAVKYPFTFLIERPGPHVFAVRYYNPGAVREYRWYDKSTTGFYLTIALADDMIYMTVQNLFPQSFLTLFLMGVFLILGIVHLLLFLFHRADKTNLYFSIFSFSFAACTFVGWIQICSTTPGFKSLMNFLSLAFFNMGFLALSGFTNKLFSRRQLRFYILCACCMVIIFLRFFDMGIAITGMVLFISAVIVEAIILITKAMFRRLKGARILGTGMLLFLFFLAYIIITVIITDHFQFEEDSLLGIIILIVGALAVISVPVSISAYLAWSYGAVNKDLTIQLVQVKQLSQKTIDQELEKQRLLETRKEELEAEVAARTLEVREQHEALKMEKKKSDDLLLNILPAEVADELKESGASKARLYNDVSVLFTDFVNFTGVSEQLSPTELVAELDLCFREFDAIITRFGLEKIKTIGDAYLAVSGLPVSNPLHAQQTVSAAIAIRDFIEYRKAIHPAAFSIRLGVHSGPVIAGIVGIKKFAYDIWGDTVNTAARMEQHGAAGRINISDATYMLVKDSFSCTPRGALDAKNKGKLNMYFAEDKLKSAAE